ncbi:hypothetical protein N0V86_004617 [Didymella sp. IMI 355093]|nr:hypothetical protein N0V86_004617 [Didymella sp. IMI 355093]
MEVPSKKMRLTVVVEALAEENAHGDYRDAALAAFKERKFAMPVQLDMTFEAVWADIEQRYKTNYLNPQQAATFSIKKLQDAYDCDLDMTDTVGDIFEAEADVKMRMIKVIPHFIYRDTSVVPGSMLRPTGAQKRGGDDVEDGANKRRRVASQQRQSTHEARDLSPNRPIPSTESQQAVAARPEDAEAARRSARSKTGASLVELGRTETGQAPFSTTAVKQEEPEPEQSPLPNGIEAASPDKLVERPIEPTAGERLSRSRTHTPREVSQEAPLLPMDDEPPEVDEAIEDELAPAPQQAERPQLDPREAAIHQSPVSSVVAEPEPEPEPEPAPAPATRQRKDLYDVSSSPEFMHTTATPDKPGTTYGRSPRIASSLLNTARGYRRLAENGTPASTANTRATQHPLADVLQSTPQETETPATRPKSITAASDEDNDDADLTASFLDEAAVPSNPQTPARTTAAKPTKPGSLKKPSRTSLVSTPASVKRGAKSGAATTPALAATTPFKGSTQHPSSSRKRSSVSSTASQSAVGTTKGKQATVFKTPARKTATPQSTETPAGTPQEKPYECPTCQARFSRDDNLKRHIRSHTAERTHVCSKCDSKFSRADILTRHQNNEHGCAGRHSSFDPEGMGIHHADTLSDTEGREKKKGRSVQHRDKITPYLDNNTKTNTHQSQVPSLLNGRHLRRGRSQGSSLLATGDPGPSKSSPAATVKASAKLKSTTPSSTLKLNEHAAKQSAVPTSTAKPMNGTIEISSAESSSSAPSEADDEAGKQKKTDVDGAPEAQATPAQRRSQRISVNKNGANDEEIALPKTSPKHKELTKHIAEPQTQDKPPSGQQEAGAARWATQSWGFEGLGEEERTHAEPEQNREPAPAAAAAAAAAAVTPTTEDEGFAEQDSYSTAVEDVAARSGSASPAASPRSSPAVSRRPARFLSHSPTPDASESEDDVDEATAAKMPSPQVNNRDESESESDSSSDSSDEEDVQMPDLPTGPATGGNAQADPPSSPPLGPLAVSTPSVTESNQTSLSQTRRPIQRTPIPPPTLQSSQGPRSSQSVSVQAVDRRRYTGFRSLREQLADTKAAQATTQKKAFDPRTMSLGKLVKGTPVTGLGGDDESSDDESSSSSSSDSD